MFNEIIKYIFLAFFRRCPIGFFIKKIKAFLLKRCKYMFCLFKNQSLFCFFSKKKNLLKKAFYICLIRDFPKQKKELFYGKCIS
jgi:hypothetical protein